MTRWVAVAAVTAVAGLAVYVGVTFVQVWRASLHDGARDADALVVMGAAQYDGQPSPALRARLEHAAQLYRRGRAPIVWVTGGNQPGDRFTEGFSGYEYLRGQGLPDGALRIENQGRSSWESLAAASRYLREQGNTDVVLVSHPYHSYRLLDIAGELGLSASVSPTRQADTSGESRVRALARETAAVSLGRLVGYRRVTGLDELLQPRTATRPPTSRARAG